RLWTELDGARREFYWDGDRLAAELDPAVACASNLYAGHDALAPLAFVDYANRDAEPETGKLYHVFCDGAGMPLHIEDDRGEIVWWASRIDPWGKIEVHESASIEYNLRWPGHYYDANTGLHYNRYRYYDPRLGRYLSPDPIGYRGVRSTSTRMRRTRSSRWTCWGWRTAGEGDGRTVGIRVGMSMAQMHLREPRIVQMLRRQKLSRRDRGIPSIKTAVRLLDRPSWTILSPRRTTSASTTME
ncbi:MAG: RHS repeat-associated core domain-containing protein, partial [Deltaproteobacteria bacterium]|nr:RHS repeat-associated core domain-containing protein [Deltaproteobacteria bacterium]